MRIAVILAILAGTILFLGIQLISDNRSSSYSGLRATPLSIGESGLPVPRFVSLKKKPTNVRKGPGQVYEIVWVFTQQNLPVEVIAEFDNWRQIRDSSGAEGWVLHSLLSGHRTALITPWQQEGTTPLYRRKDTTSDVLAHIEPHVYGDVLSCDGRWCLLEIDTYRGWIQQTKLWGVYLGEIIK